jgi:hypothetical protein
VLERGERLPGEAPDVGGQIRDPLVGAGIGSTITLSTAAAFQTVSREEAPGAPALHGRAEELAA